MIAYADVPCAEEREADLRGPWRRIRLPGKTEVVRWAELLDYEAGLLQPRKIPLLLPDDLTPDERRVAEEIRLMLALRDDRWEGKPFTWARRMNRARTGLSNDRARAALDGLRHRRLLVDDGKARGSFGGANTYRVGLLIDVLRSADAIADAIVETFDAEILPDMRQP